MLYPSFFPNFYPLFLWNMFGHNGIDPLVIKTWLGNPRGLAMGKSEQHAIWCSIVRQVGLKRTETQDTQLLLPKVTVARVQMVVCKCTQE
jgi:hypothetical protein